MTSVISRRPSDLSRPDGDKPFTVDGREIKLDHYKRYDNPYCQAEFDTNEYVISYHGKTMTVDFNGKENR